MIWWDFHGRIGPVFGHRVVESNQEDADSMNAQPRLSREKQTIDLMVGIYCHAYHHVEHEVCRECLALLEYAHRKIEKCPYHELKPTCASCTIHCYKGQMREGIRTVMRYSGPRMLLRHPRLALLHVLDKRREPK